MLKFQFFLLSLIILLFTPFSGYGQYYKLTRYADHNGIPSRMTRASYQDQEGFLWVAGNNGLYRFDGQQFVSYYATLKDTFGLRGNKINVILQTKDQNIWVGTNKGLHAIEKGIISYKKLQNKSTDDEEYVLSLLEDNEQNLWIGTYGGLFVIEKSSGNRYLISETDSIIPKSVFWSMTLNKKGRILFFSKKKAFISSKKEKFKFHKLELIFKDDLVLKDINIFKLTEFKNNLFIIGSSSGLLRGTLKKDTILTISKFKTTEGTPLSANFIENFIIDSEQNIWVATWRNYFKKYKLINNTLQEQEVLIKNGFLDMSSNVTSVYEDSQKNIWITNTNGLFKLTEDKGNLFTFPPSHLEDCFVDGFNIKALTEDTGGHLWMVDGGNLYRFNKLDILQRNCPTDFLFIENPLINNIHNIFIDSQNRIWINSNKGIMIAQLDKNYNPGKFIHISEKNGLPHNWNFDIYEEDKNNYWLANYIGLLKLTFQNNNFSNPTIKRYNSDQEREEALINSFTLDLEKDSENNLWVGTFNGLSKLVSSEELGSFDNYTSSFGEYNKISNNSIKTIFLDRSHHLWIGTQRGLNLYLKESNSFIQFGRKDGLPSEYILGLQEDSNGFLWVATTNGIMKAMYNDSINTFTKFQYFSSRDGLIDNITNKKALYIDPDDNVYIGSSKGLSIYKKSIYKETSKKRGFNLALTSLKSTQKNNQGFISIKKRFKNNKIKLSHFENSLQIHYAALDFTDLKYIKYRHKLLPNNDNWINTESSSELTYYNLSSGEYDLILDGSNNGKDWSNEPILLHITITPPFWKSNIAYIIYFVLLAGLLRFFYLLRLRKAMRELAHKSNLEKALIKEREQLRQENTADFHDELGSKVTKVSLFLTLAERSLLNKEDPTKWFSKIRSNTKDISTTFRDLLWVIDPKKDSLSDTFLRLKDFGEELFNYTDVDFRTSGYKVDQSNFILDPQTKKQVVFIFKEAMNNCAKYADSKKVILKLKSNISYSTLELEDDGIGFVIQSRSKGRGLKNMKNRAKKIGAELKISSILDKGTSIELKRIPHLSDDNLFKDV